MAHEKRTCELNLCNWPAPKVSGFIAQWVEHRTGNREVTGSNLVKVLNFFFFLASLRNCINWVHCDDHFFIFTNHFGGNYWEAQSKNKQVALSERLNQASLLVEGCTITEICLQFISVLTYFSLQIFLFISKFFLRLLKWIACKKCKRNKGNYTF